MGRAERRELIDELQTEAAIPYPLLLDVRSPERQCAG